MIALMAEAAPVAPVIVVPPHQESLIRQVLVGGLGGLAAYYMIRLISRGCRCGG